MDRRQLKTRKAIFSTFCDLLKVKKYEHITVQEIIESANVGRSTFYDHFETKDLLLNELCKEIFYHVFEKDPCPWVGRDYDLKSKITHILWHIQDSINDVFGLSVMVSSSSEIFMRYFMEHLKAVFILYLDDLDNVNDKDFVLNHLVYSFWGMLMWWLKSGLSVSPELLAEKFISTMDMY